MTNKAFKVKFGLDVGDTVASIDGTTGNIVTQGDAAINGGDLTTTSTTASLFNANTTILNIGGDATTTNIGKSLSGKVIIGNDLQITGNDILTGDGTTALTFTNITGDVDVNGDLRVNGNDVFLNNATSNIINWSAVGTGAPTTTTRSAGTKALLYPALSGSQTDYAIGIDAATLWSSVPVNSSSFKFKWYGATTEVASLDGTGNLVLSGDVTSTGFTGGNVTVGVATDQTVSTTTGNLVLDSATGIITLNSSGVTGVTLTPITSQIPYTLFAGNMIKGAIRDATTLAAGNMFSFSSGTGGPTRGLSIDNSATGSTTQRPGIVLRAYGGGLGGGNPVASFISETARGSAATPTGLSSGNGLGSWFGNGYADTSVGGASPGWVSDTTGNVPASIGFITTEAWTSGTTNLGTQVSIRTNPTGSSNAIQTSMAINPQSTISRSDAFTWQNGKTGTTQTMALDVSGQLTVNGNIKTLGTGTFNNELAVNAVSELLNTNTASGTSLAIQTNYRPSSGSATYSLPQTGWQLGNFRFNSYNTTAGAYALGAQVTAGATENWTGSANGSSINFFATKQGTTYTTGLIGVISASPETTIFKSDLLTIQNSASVNLVGGKIVYGRQYIEAYSTQDQTNPVANAENLMSFNNTGISNGVSIVTNGTTLTRITMANAGIYNIQFSAQLNQTTGGAHNAFIWLKKNGTNVADSAGDTRVAGNGDRIMAAWNYIVNASAGDYYELAWASSDTNVLLDYVAAAGVVPAIPSVILTVVPVGA